MLWNYIKIAFRQLWKQKLFSALNIFGLAVAMSVCLLIIMILTDQYGYDTFHENGDRVYRVITAKERDFQPKTPNWATTSFAVADELQENYPFIESVVRLKQISREIQIEDKKINTDVSAFFVDNDFVDVFSFGWTAGDKRTALLRPRSVVLTTSTAKRLFPHSDPLGASFTLNNFGEFTVTGILPDPPIRSHIQFDYLISYATVDILSKEQKESAYIIEEYDVINRGWVYLLLDEKNQQAQLNKALSTVAADYSIKDGEHNYLFRAQALGDVLPSDDLNNDLGVGTPKIIPYFLMVLGLVILFAACFNYTSLAIARSLKRAKEIGVRKVIGARKKDIIFQFLGESIVIALLSLVVALGLLELLIPAFYGLDPFIAETIYLERTPIVYLIFIAFSLLVGLLAGSLPAFNIAKLRPIQAIQKLSNIKLFARVGIQKVLITVQLALSLIFILIVTIILQQQNHVLNKDFGIRIDNMLNVEMGQVDYTLFAQKVRQIKDVEAVSASRSVLLMGGSHSSIAVFNEAQDSLKLFHNAVSSDYINNLDIELIAGNNLPANTNSKGEQFVLLNELATKRMGFDAPDMAIGHSIQIDTVNLSVSGVVKDFQHDNIWFDPIQPFALRQNVNEAYNANIRINPANTAATLASIRAVGKELSGNEPLHFYFTDARIYHLSNFFKMGSRIIGFVGFLTIIIACLGLLGMVLYHIEGRLKEVGIRKVLGASKKNIIWHLSKGFLLLMGIAILLATPLTIAGANVWLQNFSTRMTITPSLVLFGVVVVLLLGMFTVVSQTYRAANSNPVDSLHSE